ncbi:MAG: acetyltransferase [Bacteroidales bacterium]|nr:acetyltransferase [Bacteroidales bacterium]
MKKEIILIGGGGHCTSCIDVIEQQGKYIIKGILDTSEKVGREILGYKIMGTDDDIENLSITTSHFFVTIGQIDNNQLRIKLFNRLKELGLKLPIILSPYAYVSPHAKIGEGTIIMHGAVVNANAIVGRNCIINSNALVEHDAIVGDYCHISTGSVLNGGVKLGEGSFFGSGAVSRQYIEIPKNSFIKANSIIK